MLTDITLQLQSMQRDVQSCLRCHRIELEEVKSQLQEIKILIAQKHEVSRHFAPNSLVPSTRYRGGRLVPP